jgi:hypothetical protein
MDMLSRVCDSLYWMSRYLERAEHTARVLKVRFGLPLESFSAVSQRHWQRMITWLGLEPPEGLSDRGCGLCRASRWRGIMLGRCGRIRVWRCGSR